MLRYVTGLYTILRGGAYLYYAVLIFTDTMATSVTGIVAGTLLFVGALFLTFGGTGIAAGNDWAVPFTVLVLGIDVLWTAGAIATSPSPVEAVWVVGSVFVVTVLVFKNPLDEHDRPDMDEDESVHGMTSRF